MTNCLELYKNKGIATKTTTLLQMNKNEFSIQTASTNAVTKNRMIATRVDIACMPRMWRKSKLGR